MKASYLVADLVQKQGGAQRFLEKQSRNSLKSGLALLLGGIGFTVIANIAASRSGRTPVLAWGAILSGVVLLLRSARLRRAARRIAEVGRQKADH